MLELGFLSRQCPWVIDLVPHPILQLPLLIGVEI